MPVPFPAQAQGSWQGMTTIEGNTAACKSSEFSSFGAPCSFVPFRYFRPSQLAHKRNAVVQERLTLEMEGDGRRSRIAFDVFEWVFTADLAEPNGAYIYK